MIGAARYFSPRYWARRFWPKVGADATLLPTSIIDATISYTEVVRTVAITELARTVSVTEAVRTITYEG